MGYHTDFEGSFKLNKPLNADQIAYLKQFCETRRVARHSFRIEQMIAEGELSDPLREAVGLSIGIDGCHFVGGLGDFGQGKDDSVRDSNRPPAGSPGLWCQWMPNDEGTEIEWDCGEKFYDYTEWLQFIIEHFLKEWGHVLNGEVKWYGEDGDDRGVLFVKDNKVEAVASTSMNSGPSWDKV